MAQRTAADSPLIPTFSPRRGEKESRVSPFSLAARESVRWRHGNLPDGAVAAWPLTPGLLPFAFALSPFAWRGWGLGEAGPGPCLLDPIAFVPGG